MAKVENILLKPTTQIEVVTNFSALPDVALAIGLFYWCVESQGTAWLPFNLGGSFYNSGLYYSNGVDWSYQKTPFGATQIEVNAGINNDKFLTSFTFENASKWLSKADLSYVDAHITNTSNPHNVTKTQIGLSNVDNTSDVNKPVSTAQSYAINLKEDSVNKSTLTTDSSSNIKFPVWSVIVSYFDINRIKSILGITTLSGSNTGDQTSIVGITGTKAQFNTAVTDGDIQYVGDAPTAHTHTLLNISDVTMTVVNLNSLDDGVNSNLHFHDTDRARANHTGTQLSSTISDIQTTITNNASVIANTAKVTNATHIGEVTGATTLTIGTNVVTNTKLAQMGANTFKANNTGITGNAVDITPTQAKTILAITNTDVSGLGSLATQSGTFTAIPQSNVTNLITDLSNKANTLHSHIISDVTGLQTALDSKVDENANIIGATKTKITFDSKGLVTAGTDATTADISDSVNKRYQTDNQNSFNDATSSIQTQINTKQATLVNATNIKTVNGSTLLGSGDLIISGGSTNLTYTPSATNGVVNSDTGTDATIPLGDGLNAGLSINNYTNTEKNKVSLLSGTNTGDETITTIQTKRPLKTVNGNSLEGVGNVLISGSGGTLITENSIFNFLNEQDMITNIILNVSITNANIKSFSFIPIETSETSLDDFSLNGLNFSMANIIDNLSFDIIATAINNASGNYTIKYLITI